jgi:molybdopterin-containing oxidoreductase family iron-sulfur binding subunit
MSDKGRHGGRDYWRSLDHLADDLKLKELAEREFPEGAALLDSSVNRRQFLALMGASLGLAGLAGCRRPVEKILPYVTAPETVVPGMPQFYASTMPLGDRAYGVVVESHEGRPTKIEGNKLHPSSRGATNLYMQAAILGLYDPDRSRHVTHDGAMADWIEFVSFWRDQSRLFEANAGQGLAVLAESFSSPTLMRLRNEFIEKFPQTRWVTYEAVSDENIYRGIEIATGQRLRPQYDFSEADVILSLDADFLLTESENVANAATFAQGRRVERPADSMNRLYVVESAYSTTGAMADHRYRLASNLAGAFAGALAHELEANGVAIGLTETLRSYQDHDFDSHWLGVVAADLAGAAGRGLVVAGRRQPPEVQALVAAINQALGSAGNAVKYRNVEDASASNGEDFAQLCDAMKAGEVETLIIAGGNPSYTSSGDLDFAAGLQKVANRVHLSDYQDETSLECNWHLPRAHFLESWGDSRSLDGTYSIVQPLIEPLHGGHSEVEFMELLASGRDRRGYETVRETWRELLPSAGFEAEWNRILHDGVWDSDENRAVGADIDTENVGQSLSAGTLSQAGSKNEGLAVEFYPSAKLLDGRYANIGWLQELPGPISKIAWDNAALLSPATAETHGLVNGDLARLAVGDQEIELPVWIIPGQADGTVALELGYGRRAAGNVGDGVGVDVYPLRLWRSPYFRSGATLTATGAKLKIANTQDHNLMEGRPLIREATLEEYRQHPEFAREMVEHPPLKSLWDEHDYDEGYQWGMNIDLNACIGCNACAIACQSENNVPIVGKEQVRMGREMHWLRIDRYFSGESETPRIVQQPVACQHCENAPCEQVCPVAATLHDSEGLNLMVYNRCIGTRYCSNNCPYKVRRFNFFNYTDDLAETVKMAQNPDVTVRSRGVMEKCTYCLQRINRAKREANREERRVRDGDVVPACQQACPVDAISFGNILDQNSEVARRKRLDRNYEMLALLNVKPRTSYLARLRNPHPDLQESD